MSVVAVISGNKIVKREIVEGDVLEVVKRVAVDLLDQWDPTRSDFVILRDFHTHKYPAPISRELFEKIKRYSPKRVGDVVEVVFPVFEIIHEALWSGGEMQIDTATLIFPHVDQQTTERVLSEIMENLSQELE